MNYMGVANFYRLHNEEIMRLLYIKRAEMMLRRPVNKEENLFENTHLKLLVLLSSKSFTHNNLLVTIIYFLYCKYKIRLHTSVRLLQTQVKNNISTMLHINFKARTQQFYLISDNKIIWRTSSR